MELRCKCCDYKWEKKDQTIPSIIYCPNCGAIGRFNDEFESIITQSPL